MLHVFSGFLYSFSFVVFSCVTLPFISGSNRFNNHCQCLSFYTLSFSLEACQRPVFREWSTTEKDRKNKKDTREKRTELRWKRQSESNRHLLLNKLLRICSTRTPPPPHPKQLTDMTNGEKWTQWPKLFHAINKFGKVIKRRGKKTKTEKMLNGRHWPYSTLNT